MKSGDTLPVLLIPTWTGCACLLAGFYLGTDKFSDTTTYDQLGDLNKIIAIDPEGGDPTGKNEFCHRRI